MTISYSNLVFTSKGIGTFLKLLLKWKGSIYKLVWRELFIYVALYCALSLVYRLALDDQGKSFTYRGAAIAQWIRLRLPSCRPGSSPKHTIYAFIIYSQICAIFVM